MSELQQIGSFSKVRRGASPRPIDDPKYFGGTVGWVRISDVTASNKYLRATSQYLSKIGEQASVRVDKGDLVMSICGTIGKPILIDMPACIHDGFVQIYDFVGADPEYLYYQLQLQAQRLTGMGQSGTQTNINTSIVERLEVFLPELPNQRRIATILSALDAQIEKTDVLIKKLLLQRTGVVQQSLLPLAEEAEDYDLGTLASLVTSGSRGWGKYYSEGGALFLRIGNLTREHPNLKLNDIVRVAVPAGGEGERTRIQEGDLLISITADLGVIGCIPSGFEEAYVNQHIALVRIESEKVHPRWVAHVLGSPYGTEQFLALNATGAKAGLTLPSVRRLRVPCPTLNKQQELVDILDSMDFAVEAERRYLKKLRLQKAGLMRDLLTGKVRVPTRDAA